MAGALTAAVTLAGGWRWRAAQARAAGHGGSGRATRPTGHVSAPATKAAAGTPKAARCAVGQWSGHYSGSYNGTFTVRWRQSGSHLHGTIHISNPSSTLPINGIVHGNADQLRHRGLDGDHLFGHRLRQLDVGHLQGQRQPGGPWSAGKA